MFSRFVGLSVRTGLMLVTAGWIGIQLPGSVRADTLTQQQISAFLADPGSLLTNPQNSKGGAGLTSMIRDLMLSPATDAEKTDVLNHIIALLGTANAAQQSAIGSGLGLAAQGLATNQAMVAAIQAALARSNSPTAIAAYSGVTGNTVIGAAGGGGGGAGGGGGGPTSGGPPSGGGGGSAGTGGVNQGSTTGAFLITSGASSTFTGTGPVSAH
jgi:hypothetical protein